MPKYHRFTLYIDGKPCQCNWMPFDTARIADDAMAFAKNGVCFMVEFGETENG